MRDQSCPGDPFQPTGAIMFIPFSQLVTINGLNYSPKKKVSDDSFEIDSEARSCFPCGSLTLHRKMVYVNYRPRKQLIETKKNRWFELPLSIPEIKIGHATVQQFSCMHYRKQMLGKSNKENVSGYYTMKIWKS